MSDVEIKVKESGTRKVFGNFENVGEVFLEVTYDEDLNRETMRSKTKVEKWVKKEKTESIHEEIV